MGLVHLCFPNGKLSLNIRNVDFPPICFGDLPTVAQCPEAKLLTTTFYHLGRKFDRLPQSSQLIQFLSGSLAPQFRFCPQCLAERGYRLLTWRFCELEGCAEHKCRLLDRCGHCGQVIPFLTYTAQMSMCPTCGGDLRDCSLELFSEASLNKVRLRTQDLVYLLSPQPCEQLGDQLTHRIGQQFARWRQVRQMRAADAADYLEQYLAFIYRMEDGPTHRVIQFRWYLKYADFLWITLRDIFERPAPAPPYQSDEEKVLHKIRQATTILEQQRHPVTQATVKQLTGLGIRVFNRYPQVKAMWAEYKANHSQSTRTIRPQHRTNSVQREAELVHKVEQAVAQLQQQAAPISQKAIVDWVGLSKSTLMSYPRVKAILKANSAARLGQDEDELLARVQAALATVEASASRVSKQAVGTIVGLSIYTLKRYPRVNAFLTEQITDRYQEHRARQLQRREAEPGVESSASD